MRVWGSPTSVAVSPDGRHVYVTAAASEAVVVFGRDPTTGRLTFVEVHKNGVDGVVKMDSPLALAISPDGKHVYATGGDDLTVAIFSRDPSTGGLSFVEAQDVFGGVAGVDIVHSVAVSPDNTSVYVTGADWYDTGEPSRPADAVAVFDRDPATGRLTLAEVHQNSAGGVQGLKDVTGVAVSPDNKNVYVVNTGRTLVVFSRETVAGRLTYVETQEDGVDGVSGLLGANEVVVSPDNEHLYVASGRGGAVAVFGRDLATGELTFLEALVGSAGGSAADLAGTSGVAVSPDGGHVYLVTENSDKLHVMQRNTGTGALTYVETLTDDVDGVDGLEGAESVTVSPDNKSVYAVSIWETVVVFSRDPGTGALTYVETQEAGVGSVVGLLGAYVVVVSPDGGHVYVASRRPGEVAVFSRDLDTGALTYVEAQGYGVGSGADDLVGAHGVAVSPDGGHVYVVADNSDRLLTFGRNLDTGALTYVETLTDNVGGVDGLEGAQSVAVSPDNRHVYVAGFDDDAVAVFSRDPVSGALTFVEVIRNAED